MSEDMRSLSRRLLSAEQATIDAINCGSLARIADACDAIAKNYSSLIQERDRYLRWYREKQEECERKGRTISALRGVITKLQAALAASSGCETKVVK